MYYQEILITCVVKFCYQCCILLHNYMVEIYYILVRYVEHDTYLVFDNMRMVCHG